MAVDIAAGRTKNLDGSHNRLCSKIYTLVVGSEKKVFLSHEVVLSQSPVFERMCNGSFKENVEKQIELPDDDENIFECMLEYMYRGVFHGVETPTQSVRAAMMADLYIMAEKYQLSGLKELLIPPLASILDDTSNSECIEGFFHAACKIYENTPDSEVLFPDSYKKRVAQILGDRNQNPYIESHIKRCIFDGGKLAQDTFDASLSSKDEIIDKICSRCYNKQTRQGACMVCNGWLH